jgi:chemotaxis signal transduction protein
MDAALQMPGAGDDPALTLVHVRLGELAIGVDARFVLHALPRPARLARLPRSHDAIDGVFVDGGRTVPLVDLRAWMGVPVDPAAPPGHVLVLGAAGRSIGLAIDAACGLVPVRQSQLRRIHHADAEDGFFHSVAPAGEDALLSLLDPLRLMERVQAWTEGGADAASGAAPATAGERVAQRTLALVRLGGALLALPARQVAQVLPRPPHQPLLAGAGSLLGMVEWQGRHLPLVDLADALALAQGDAPLMLVLGQGESRIAFPIDATLAVRSLPLGALVPAAEAGLAHPLVAAVALDQDGERILVLDDEALLRSHAAPGLAAAEANASAADASRTETHDRRAGAHLVFDSGRLQAMPMELLEEILPLPQALDDGAAQPSGLPPTLLWRERGIPVLDLREHGRGATAARAPQRLVVVRHGGRHAALRVWDVVELLAAQQGELLEFAAPGKGRMRAVTVENEGVRASYPVFDPGSLPFFMPSA